MIRLEHIHLQFADRTLLEDECLCLREGRVHVLMGRSGSGKTTLLNEIALNGSGQSLVYEWNGIEVSALREEKKAQLRRAQIGYVMQDLEVIDSRLTLEENLKCVCALAGRAYDRQEAEQTMRMLRLDMDLNKRIETLSRGERQRFALLSVLQKGAQLIVCDEPTSALDKENARLFLQLLKETAISRRKIVVIATHDDRTIIRLLCMRE